MNPESEVIRAALGKRLISLMLLKCLYTQIIDLSRELIHEINRLIKNQ